jgi:hypothetical protein
LRAGSIAVGRRAPTVAGPKRCSAPRPATTRSCSTPPASSSPAAEVEAIAARAALVVVVVEPEAEHTLGWLRSGAEDVIGPDELLGPPAGGGCASRSSGAAAAKAASRPMPPIPAPACRTGASWSST